ncbi:amino acid permease C-terminal domain-containing protein [Aneurinibacillus migulanus]|uniref:amino acid permease C-terminal domain-containing protein n=1 Tax=Aneurinibacillus migulanus TaxID=47500 RepID=UPI003991E08C
MPILSILACGYLMISLPSETWLAFVIWLIIRLLVYFFYSRRYSNLYKLHLIV